MEIPRLPKCCTVLVLLLCSVTPLFSQLSNPLPSLTDSGLAVEIEPWITIPQSNPGGVLARINHVKPCPDGARLFCNDMRGKLWMIASNQAYEATEFLDLADHFPRFIDSPGRGTGFSSFAFHPEFSTRNAPGFGKFYTSHSERTSTSPPPDFVNPQASITAQYGVVTEWYVNHLETPQKPPGSLKFSQRELFRIAFPSNVHGLQEIAMDPNAQPGDDNYACLFVCVGDGGSAAIELPGNTGRVDSILGTIVRIVPTLGIGQSASDYLLSDNGAYYIPESNPFVAMEDPSPGDGLAPLPELYAYGFRNPHRISWDTGGTGKMICGMIGEKNIEEIELVEPGGHYGWPVREGSYKFFASAPDSVYELPDPDPGPTDFGTGPPTFSYPVAQFDHGDGRAIVGGYVYRGTRIPELQGMYVCGDIVLGKLYVVPEGDLVLQQPASSGDAPATVQNLGVNRLTSPTTFLSLIGENRADLRFGIDHDGELFMLSKQTGRIYRVISSNYNFVEEYRVNIKASTVTVTFPTEIGKFYRMWYSEDLQNWDRTAIIHYGHSAIGCLSNRMGPPTRFYRIEVMAP